MEKLLNISNQFISYKIALALKELGFDEPCFSYFTILGKFANDISNPRKYNSEFERGSYISAPLWQQVIDWLLGENIVYLYDPRKTKDEIAKEILECLQKLESTK